MHCLGTLRLCSGDMSVAGAARGQSVVDWCRRRRQRVVSTRSLAVRWTRRDDCLSMPKPASPPVLLPSCGRWLAVPVSKDQTFNRLGLTRPEVWSRLIWSGSEISVSERTFWPQSAVSASRVRPHSSVSVLVFVSNVRCLVTDVDAVVRRVSCPAGQRSQTGHAEMTTLCTRSGHWAPPVPDCVGMSKHWTICSASCVRRQCGTARASVRRAVQQPIDRGLYPVGWA